MSDDSYPQARPVLHVHIGMNKTGSTSLQHFLFANRALLRERGIIYPDPEGFMFQGAHHRLAGSFFPRHNWAELQKCAGGIDNPETMLSILREEIGRSKNTKHIVISSELFGLEDSGKAVSALQEIQDLCDIRIIVYIRNYPDFLESLLAHRITCSDYDKDLVTEKFKRDFCLQLKGHYSKIIDPYSRGLGRENVIVRVMEKGQLKGGGVLSDFLSLLGQEMDGKYQATGTKNVSLQRNGLEYMMIMNRMRKNGLVDPVQFRVTRMMLRQLPDEERYSLFSSGLRAGILDWSKEECRYIAREYLGRDDGILFANPWGREISGGENYPGLAAEFMIRANLAIVERSVSQGAFRHIRESEEGCREKPDARKRVLKDLCLKVPGVRILRNFVRN